MMIALIWLHFLGDFVLQSRKMADNKSTSLNWLLFHVVIYSSVLCLISWRLAIINGVFHFLIDGATSNMTKEFYKDGKIHAFFTTIGFDQALHLTILYFTMDLLKSQGLL
jgi:hypothetical protein